MIILLRAKNNYFANINISSITDNKKFWRTVNWLIDGQIVPGTFNNYFKNIVKNLLTQTNESFLRNKANGFNLNLSEPIEVAISKYKNRPSLNAI